jgi:hypothetical protein
MGISLGKLDVDQLGLTSRGFGGRRIARSEKDVQGFNTTAG